MPCVRVHLLPHSATWQQDEGPCHCGLLRIESLTDTVHTMCSESPQLMLASFSPLKMDTFTYQV